MSSNALAAAATATLSSPPSVLTSRTSVVSPPEMLVVAASPRTLDRGIVRRDVDRVGPAGAVDQDGVVLGVGRTGGGGEVDLGHGDLGAAEVVRPSRCRRRRRSRGPAASTPSRSIRMFPWVRRKTALGPLADSDICSSPSEPLKTRASWPSPPSIASLPSPGFQAAVSSPLPSTSTSVPTRPLTKSAPRATDERVRSCAAQEEIRPRCRP